MTEHGSFVLLAAALMLILHGAGHLIVKATGDTWDSQDAIMFGALGLIAVMLAWLICTLWLDGYQAALTTTQEVSIWI